MICSKKLTKSAKIVMKLHPSIHAKLIALIVEKRVDTAVLLLTKINTVEECVLIVFPADMRVTDGSDKLGNVFCVIVEKSSFLFITPMI